MTIEELIAELKALVEQAEAEDRPLTDQEAQRADEIDAEVKRFEKTAEVKNRSAGYVKVRNDAPKVSRAVKQEDTLERAFEAFLRTGEENADIAELKVRAQSEGTGSEGGYLVPDGFRNKIVDRLKDFGGVRSVAQVETTTSGNNLRWVTTDDTSNLGEIVLENGSFVGGADVVYGTATLGAYSYMAGGAGATPLRVPKELLQDAEIDIQADISKKLAERIYRIQAVHLVSGTGAGQPQGLVYGLTGVQTAANNALTYDDLVHYEHSVDSAYRKSGNMKWLFNDKSLETIKKLKDSHGDPIWRPSTADMATGTGGGTLLGYPVVIDAAFPDFTNNSATINWGAFGDFKEGYVVRDVKGVEILVDPYTRMANRQIQFCAWARMDAVQQNTNAYVALTGKV